MSLRILHAADLHLDSPFEGLGAGKAAVRRGEQRALLGRIADLALSEKADIVLFAGDLLDSDNTFYETGEELIRSLKDRGYGIYLLSNASVAQHEYWPKFPVSRYFDGKLISCDVNVVKPCHRIFELFIERFALKPEECLFIDDAPANVAGAVDCGWHGIVFNGDTEELKQKMALYGITVKTGKA